MLVATTLGACAHPHDVRVTYTPRPSYRPVYTSPSYCVAPPVYYRPRVAPWDHIDPRIPLNGYGAPNRPPCRGTTYIIPNPW